MDIQEQLLKLSPQTQIIELDHRGIYRVDGLIELFKKFKDLRKISLKNNHIKYLPDNITHLQSLEEIDISGNPIEHLNDLIVPLSNLRNLKALGISLSSFDEEQFIIEQLVGLEYLNQKKITHESPMKSEDNEEEQHRVKYQKKIQQTNYNFIQQQYYNIQKQIEFEDYEFFKNENLEEASMIFQDLKELYKENNMGNEEELQAEYDQNTAKLISDLKEKCEQQNNEKYLKNLVQLKQKYSLYELCFSKAIEFTQKLDERLFEAIASIHDSHAIIFKQMSKMITEQDKIINQLQNEQVQQNVSSQPNLKSLQYQVEHLQEENKRYLDKIIRISKGEHPLRDSTSYKLNTNVVNNKGDLGNTQGSINISINNAKNLSLNQLKEVIQEIYASKEWFDTKDQKNQKLPPQTMEMHMYEYLTQKYGLKSIVIEQASTIIYSIKKLSIEDNDIAVFTKILRNECDENFRFVQGQLKRTIKELLNMHLKGKYPLKNTVELKTMVDTKSSGLISLEEASDIISYMYNKEDSLFLMDKIKDLTLYQQSSPLKKKGQKREDAPKEPQQQKKKITYNLFEKVILDFQLKSHEKFLKPFIVLFKLVDSDQDGVVSEDEFRELINLANIPLPLNEADKFLKILDPYTTSKITFSQIVNLFSEEIIVVDNTSMSILQHLSVNQNN